MMLNVFTSINSFSKNFFNEKNQYHDYTRISSLFVTSHQQFKKKKPESEIKGSLEVKGGPRKTLIT